MKIDKLEDIIIDMRNDNVKVFNFEYKNNYTLSVLIFDIEQIIITFTEIGTNNHFEVPVNSNYEINTFLSLEDLSLLKNMLHINSNSGNKFSTNKFFEHFANSLPNYSNSGKREVYDCAKYLSKYIEEPDRTAYVGIIRWGIDGHGNARKKNLNKTLTYLGEKQYKRFKELNISSKWTSFEELDNNPVYKKYRHHKANTRQRPL